MCRKALLMCIVILMAQSLYADTVSVKTKIAYVKDGYVYVCGEDGTDAVKVSPKGNYFSLRWSPDGKHIACINSVEPREVPCIITVDSKRFMVLKNTAYSTSIPSWSPDSRSIIFSCSEKMRDIDILPSNIYIYNIATKQLKIIIKLTKVDRAAPVFLSMREIVYADDSNSSIVRYDLTTKKSTRIKVADDNLISPDFVAVEMIPFANCMVVVIGAEQGFSVNLNLLKPGSSSWLPNIIRRLVKSLQELELDASEFTPGADGRIAYVVLNNEGDLSEDVIPQSRAYKLDAQGSHLLFSITGAKYSIHEVSPFGGSRIIYLRLRSLDPRIGDLRIYDLNTKTSKTLVGDVSTSTVWRRQ